MGQNLKRDQVFQPKQQRKLMMRPLEFQVEELIKLKRKNCTSSKLLLIQLEFMTLKKIQFLTRKLENECKIESLL